MAGLIKPITSNFALFGRMRPVVCWRSIECAIEGEVPDTADDFAETEAIDTCGRDRILTRCKIGSCKMTHVESFDREKS